MEPSMKEEILAQLREESAAQLEEHKHLLEQEYQKRLDSFMSQFKPVDGSPNLKDGSSSSSASKARVTARVEDSSIAARHIIKLVSGGKGARIMTPKELAPAAAAASAAAAEEGCSNTKKAKLVADVLPERTVKTYITSPSGQQGVGADPLRNKSQALALTSDWLSPVHGLPSKQSAATLASASPNPSGSGGKAKSKAKQQATAAAGSSGEVPLDLAARIAKNDFPLHEQELLLDRKMNNVTKYLLHKTEFLLKEMAGGAATSPLCRMASKPRVKGRRHGRDIEDVIYDSLMEEGRGALPDVFASPSVGLGSSPGSAPRQLLPSSPSPNSNPLAEAVAEGPSAEDQGMARRQLPLLGRKLPGKRRGAEEQQQERQEQQQEEQPPRPPSHSKPSVKYANSLVHEGHYSKVNDVAHGSIVHSMPAHGWQNDIARHILSVFASQKTKDTAQPQHKVMHYVDPFRLETLETVKEHLEGEGADVLKIVTEFETVSISSSSASPKRRGGGGAIGGDDGASVGTAATARTAGTRGTASGSSHSLTDAEAAQKYITDLAKASKFRKTQMVRAPYVETPSDEPTSGAFRWRSKHLRRGVDVALRSSPNVVPIWFVSTGELDSNWTVLPGGSALQAQLNVMYENRGYMEYLCVLESIILKLWAEAVEPPAEKRSTINSRTRSRSPSPAKGKSPSRGGGSGSNDPLDDASHVLTSPDAMWDYEIGRPVDVFAARAGPPGAVKARTFSKEEVAQLWKKFIITANAMVLLCCEGKWFNKCIDLLTRLEEWGSREDMLPAPFRAEVKAYLYDSFSYFFYRKKKNRSALNNSLKSLAIYERANNVECISIVLLHICCVHVQNNNYKEAHRVVQEFLLMINDGRLSSADTTPKMLCLACIGYHNLAVVQLKMDVPDLAAKSSQSARKIAKLCLSYSNRWLATFERTHECAVEEIKFQMAANHGLEHRVIQVSDPLITELYSHNADLSVHDRSGK